MRYLPYNLFITVAMTFGASLYSSPTMAVDLYCSGIPWGDLFIDTASGEITKNAEETITSEVATSNSHYRFEFKGKTNKFKAVINRTNGEIILSDACTPTCWGGPVYGTCSTVKAKF